MELSEQLLRWYDAHRRALPWRDIRDPYSIWVSEVMLQQTQVSVVIPYYAAFLGRFPTLADLAAASLDEVLKVWEGLGYYARARNLHAAARRVVAEHGGRLPQRYAELRQLPGLGDYTAGAIASIAFGECVPAVDANARRVLIRLLAISEEATRPAMLRHLRKEAYKLLPCDRPGDFNQALMELGALICTPQSPRCAECPWRSDCQACALGIQETLPRRRARTLLPHMTVTAGVIRGADGRVLIAQRRPDAMLGGLWEFPGGKCQDGETLTECLRREVREELGVIIAVEHPLVTLRHRYTHSRITLHVFTCRLVAGEPRALACADWRWATLADLSAYAFPATDRKIVALLQQGDTTQRV
ncbi:MAG: A/G-specific adenine glycosylase [Anaerolineae bacterium]